MNSAEFVVKNPKLGHLLTLVILLFGTFSAMQLRRETFPEISMDVAIVSTVFPNASPEEVEELITRPIEDEIRELDDIKEYNSQSVEGVSSISIIINPDAKDKQRVINNLQRNIDRVKLPDGAEEPVLTEIKNDEPVIRVCLFKKSAEYDLRSYIERLEQRFELIDGVSKVSRYGWREEEYWVEVDPSKLSTYQISLTEVVNTLQRRNINLPGGKIPNGDQEIILRTIGKFHSVDEILDIVIRSNFAGNAVTIRDIADVRRTFEPDAAYVMSEGKRLVMLGVKKSAKGDVIHISDSVREVVEEEKRLQGDDIEYLMVDDQAYYVKRRLMVVKNNGIIGILLVMICLLMFINFRVALFTAFGIPFSFLVAFLLLAWFGGTINLMTMFGLIIVLGMVVDDAIIVGENIFRHMEEGMETSQAAICGTREVMLPVIATVLTTVAAFSPLIFAPDVYGKFLRWLTFVVIMTLAGSLFECLFVLPAHIAEFAKSFAGGESDRHRKGLGNRLMQSQIRFYRWSMRKALRLRYATLLVIVGGFAGMGVFVKKHMVFDIFPKDLIDVISVPISTPTGSTLAYTERKVKEVEAVIRQLPDGELDSTIGFVGTQMQLNGISAGAGTRYGQLLVYLTPQETRERKTVEIKNELSQMVEKVQGLDQISFDLISPGPPTGRPLEISIVGDDFASLRVISEEIQHFLDQRSGVNDVQDDMYDGKGELHLKVDENESKRLGLDLMTVAETVFTAFEGAKPTVVREGKEELDVRVRLKEPYRSQIEQVEKLTIPNRAGRLIPLDAVARFEEAVGVPSIAHHNGQRAITVSATIDTDETKSMLENEAVFEQFSDISQRFPGYRLISGGEWKEDRKIIVFMVKAFVAAIVLIYVILVLQFNSFAQPFILLASIPLGFIGVIMALILHGKPVSMMALMGMVGLAGVVVNDAIVLVSFINNERKKGGTTLDAVVNAGAKRLRPILLTSVTTVAGLMPVIFGIGGYEPFIVPAAITLAYGLVAATVLTLVVVPCLYMVLKDLRLIRDEGS